MLLEPVQKFICNSEFGRLCGVKRRKPGFPLQSFLPQTAKKDFRCNPLRSGSG
jgi:hypothetical protein